MPILLFLIDTSASMNQRTYLGTTFLDIAKGAVEIFMKLRARDPASRGDRYMLVTFDDPPYGVKRPALCRVPSSRILIGHCSLNKSTRFDLCNSPQ
uniref:VWFA domain-containing protein n=1 Tax=Sinocyclocheilus anshuiensis TaxID=1608454 RepID=A0A671LV78_9TELE